MGDVGVDIGSQLLQGMVQGKKLRLEQDRLKQESKTQDELTTYRTRLWEQQEQQLGQQQSQHEDMMQYRGEELDVRERDISERNKMRETQQNLLNYFNQADLDQKQAKALSGVQGDYSDVIQEIRLNEWASPADKEAAMEQATQSYISQLVTLGFGEEELQKYTDQAGMIRDMWLAEEGEAPEAEAPVKGPLDKIKEAGYLGGTPDRKGLWGTVKDMGVGANRLIGNYPSEDDVWNMYMEGAFGEAPTGPNDTPVTPPQREAMKKAQAYLANATAMQGGK